MSPILRHSTPAGLPAICAIRGRQAMSDPPSAMRAAARCEEAAPSMAASRLDGRRLDVAGVQPSPGPRRAGAPANP